MTEIIKKSINIYKVIFIEWADPVAINWPLVAKPYQGLFILAIYLMFVLKWGPKWMKNRPAFNLDKVMMVYNAIQVLACIVVFVTSIVHAWGWKYRWHCEPIDYSNTDFAIKVRLIVYLYYLLKVADLLDTVFFVLRKKLTQVTFLHVYHHWGMVMLAWGSITYLPGGHSSLVGVINSFVHVVMYSYYFLTVAVPSIKKSLWWKKHITQLQIVQFFLCIAHMSVLVFKTDCGYPRWTAAVFLPQNIFVLVLFVDFYIKTYINKKSHVQKNCSSKEVDNYCEKNGNHSSSSGINSFESQKTK